MKRGKPMHALVLTGALALLSPQAPAQVAGRVLLAAGDVAAIRDGKQIRLAPGAPVHDRDTLTTGAASNLQVRLTDESIISLREGSQLRIDEYRFTGREGAQERALFRLLKGAFRTITGLIGRTKPKDYAVATATATIGIRGTIYALAQCQKDCQNPDGSLAPDGVYGSVIGFSYGTNQLTVSNNAGDAIIGTNQHFHVADANSPPTLLLEPPSFLRDRLTGAKPKGAPAAAPVAAAGIAAESRPSTLPDVITQVGLTTTQTLFVASQNLQAGGLPAALTVNGTSVGFAPVGGSGDIRGQLVWLNNSDMDLHMTAPNGAHVFYANTTVILPGGATAALDADNLGGVINVPPNQRIENIRVSGATPPTGSYTFFVNAFLTSTPTSSVLTVTGDNNVTRRVHNVPALSTGQNSQNYQVIFNGPGVAPTYNP